jgi:hypothetical protein
MASLLVVDKFALLQLAKVEPGLSLMEWLLCVELVAVGCAHDVGVHVLLSHKELSIADHRVLREARAIVEAVLGASEGVASVVKAAMVGVACAPVAFVLCGGAVEGRAEVCGPAVGLEVRSCVH